MRSKTTRNSLRSLILATTFLLSIAMVGNAIVAADAGEDCRDCELSAQSFDNQDFAWVDFSGSNLYRASMLLTDLSHANLSNAKLTRANLAGANLSNAVLVGADLTGANLLRANTTDIVTDSATVTDETTTCPNGTPGPCTFSAE